MDWTLCILLFVNSITIFILFEWYIIWTVLILSIYTCTHIHICVVGCLLFWLCSLACFCFSAFQHSLGMPGRRCWNIEQLKLCRGMQSKSGQLTTPKIWQAVKTCEDVYITLIKNNILLEIIMNQALFCYLL